MTTSLVTLLVTSCIVAVEGSCGEDAETWTWPVVGQVSVEQCARSAAAEIASMAPAFDGRRILEWRCEVSQ